MHDMEAEWKNNNDQIQVATCDPHNWISTEQLEIELFNAIIQKSKGITGDEDIEFDDIDEYFDDEDEEDERGQRRSTLRLLAMMRPQLGELLGAPPAE
jgi:hypothetical protein